MFKQYVQWRLERYIKKYFKKHHPTLIVVVGSVGKTTTKTAIATALAGRYRTQLEAGNLNTPLSVPLALMGVKYPPTELIHQRSTWRQVFRAMRQRVKAPQGVDVIIQELGTDHPGDLATYANYLSPDIMVLTAVSPEHMESFPGGLDQVAREEFTLSGCSGLVIVGNDDVDSQFVNYANTGNLTSYGIDGGQYQVDVIGGSPLAGYEVVFTAPELSQPIRAVLHVVGNHMLKSACAAVTVGLRMGVPVSELVANIEKFRPVPGRMNPLPGRRNSTLIDDTYNSSPIAAIAALQTLYQIEAPQRIAILGTMNELGNYALSAHQQVGSFCDPAMLDWVITIGDMANQQLALAARKNGCQTRTFADPVSAGTFASQVLKEGAVVLIKGSQDRVYAEEATKVLLRDGNDVAKLVRQDECWKKRKQEWFTQLGKHDEEELEEE